MRGFVYLLRAMGTSAYKIGKTKRAPLTRLQGLQTGSYTKLELIASAEVDHYAQTERRIHQELKAYRAEGGREWYHLPFPVEQIIAFFNQWTAPQGGQLCAEC